MTRYEVPTNQGLAAAILAPWNGIRAEPVAYSGRLIRNQRPFDPRDLVLQLQLALLQPLERQLVGLDVGREALDHGVQIAVFLTQFDHAPGQACKLGGIVRLAHGRSIARRRRSADQSLTGKMAA